MTDRPIIFSGPMVRALLDGRKTQTRRVLKPQPPADVTSAGVIARSNEGQTDEWTWLSGDPKDCDTWETRGEFKTRYVPGDRLWVRETWGINHYDYGGRNFIPKQRPADLDDEHLSYLATEADAEIRDEMPYRPSIHMPRWASRLTLHVTGVKVERLQDISEDDAIAEGATRKPRCYGYGNLYDGWSMDWKEPAADYALVSASMAFGSFINELHGGPRWSSKPGPSLWDSNPWVVAVTFRVVKANIDSAEAKAAE